MAIADDFVDVALVLAMDCSGSVSNEDEAMQRMGYARAVTSQAFLANVRAGQRRAVGLTFVHWNGAGRQEQAVPWARIGDEAGARRFALAILNAPGLQPDYTSISGAIDFGHRLIKAAPFNAERAVIDISGDGANNDGRDVTQARDAAIAAGITINGLPIVRQEADIEAYYRTNVIGGEGAFVEVARGLDSFPLAIQRKMCSEIA